MHPALKVTQPRRTMPSMYQNVVNTPATSRADQLTIALIHTYLDLDKWTYLTLLGPQARFGDNPL